MEKQKTTSIKKKLLVAAIILIIMVLAVTIGAIATSYSEMKNESTFDTDTVDIAVDAACNEDRLLLPGTTVGETYYVMNYGSDCFIRLKSYVELDDLHYVYAHSQQTNPNWVYNEPDGYWYYKYPIKEGEYIDFFAKCGIPSDDDWDNVWKTNKDYFVVETIEVEAVQAQFNIPDFESSDPWSGVQPEKRAAHRIGINPEGEIKQLDKSWLVQELGYVPYREDSVGNVSTLPDNSDNKDNQLEQETAPSDDTNEMESE